MDSGRDVMELCFKSNMDVVVVEENQLILNEIAPICAAHNIWHRVLLVQANLGASILDNTNLLFRHDLNPIPQMGTSSDIFYYLGNLCPKLLRILSGDDLGNSVFNSLLSSYDVIIYCNPMIFLDMTNNFQSAPAIINYLQLLDYEMWWTISWKVDIDTLKASIFDDSSAKTIILAFHNLILIGIIATKRGEPLPPMEKYIIFPLEMQHGMIFSKYTISMNSVALMLKEMQNLIEYMKLSFPDLMDELQIDENFIFERFPCLIDIELHLQNDIVLQSNDESEPLPINNYQVNLIDFLRPQDFLYTLLVTLQYPFNEDIIIISIPSNLMKINALHTFSSNGFYDRYQGWDLIIESSCIHSIQSIFYHLTNLIYVTVGQTTPDNSDGIHNQLLSHITTYCTHLDINRFTEDTESSSSNRCVKDVLQTINYEIIELFKSSYEYFTYQNQIQKRLYDLKASTMTQAEDCSDGSNENQDICEYRNSIYTSTDYQYHYYESTEVARGLQWLYGHPHSPDRSENHANGMNKGNWLINSSIFGMKMDSDYCSDPIWCDHTVELQRRIKSWQYPDDPTSYVSELERSSQVKTRSCSTAQFLVFEPFSNMHGIGSIFEVTAAIFRYAICLNRILILNSFNESQTLLKWRHPGCREGLSTLECYIEDISGCHLSCQQLQEAVVISPTDDVLKFPFKNIKILKLQHLPTGDPCGICHSALPDGLDFLDGLYVDGDSNHVTLSSRYTEAAFTDLVHMRAFMSSIKQVWTSQFLRYLIRPKKWFAKLIKDTMLLSLYSPSGTDGVTYGLPERFISLHIRYGMKIIEESLHPIEKYMKIIRYKLPYIKDIFISTESEFVIQQLIKNYEDYRFHFIRYPRLEYIDLGLTNITLSTQTDYISEFIFSMVNLDLSSKAFGFVGTLTSNWCTMIHHLERTRGDGGYDYYSVDKGSAFSTCF